MTLLTLETTSSIGERLKYWRSRRHLTQFEFALDVEVSQRHLSFIESGRASPSRDMVLRLAERLDVPLRERNEMLLAAGYAPIYPRRELTDPALDQARLAMDMILKGHEPYPAMVVDRHWNIIASNGAVAPILSLISDPELLKPPINALRLSLAPGGLSPHIRNLAAWRSHVLDRIRHSILQTADPGLIALHDELTQLIPASPRAVHRSQNEQGPPPMVIPLELSTPMGDLNLFTTVTVFGTPLDVTLSELAIEAFYPADAPTAQRLRQAAEPG
jgi:transcriptional regulator with XRE-family HTH domain